MHDFDQDYWERQWGEGAPAGADERSLPVNPYLMKQAQSMTPARALDAGCGTGVEAVWLAAQGWQVTGVDISATALTSAQGRVQDAGVADRVDWVQADLTTWEPDQQYELVSTNYAHASIPQLELYQRLAQWVAPGGVLIIVGHLHRSGAHHHQHHGSADAEPHPEEATVTVEAIASGFDPHQWRIDSAQEHTREVTVPGGRSTTPHDSTTPRDSTTLHDAVVIVRRLS
ncbi:class I SAM-dependent methyltransferase [Garicola koreensis]|uniref:Trans-aconitate methyltransferase n=1 Tax=Garicola koreensis TaxID=1262554 RepID=A0A7W5TVF7_9MICC|nr:class I SAM-dependent methyltransferase [Garicola koreensis]MBB3668322.1 trans-aconitate methyltransferase [Garicola koreensis]MBB3668428.1 trans-aconitate methyltransferase [Garicola koreensis]